MEPYLLLFSSAIQYYVAGRYAVFAELNPTAANLLHHAVEMCLKAALAKKGQTLAELKKHSHRIEDIWNEFRATHAGDFNRCDRIIAELHKFESIRYPDEIEKGGLESVVGRGSPPASQRVGNPKGHELYLGEIDDLIVQISAAASIKLKAFTTSNTSYQQFLEEENDSIR